MFFKKKKELPLYIDHIAQYKSMRVIESNISTNWNWVAQSNFNIFVDLARTHNISLLNLIFSDSITDLSQIIDIINESQPSLLPQNKLEKRLLEASLTTITLNELRELLHFEGFTDTNKIQRDPIIDTSYIPYQYSSYSTIPALVIQSDNGGFIEGVIHDLAEISIRMSARLTPFFKEVYENPFYGDLRLTEFNGNEGVPQNRRSNDESYSRHKIVIAYLNQKQAINLTWDLSDKEEYKGNHGSREHIEDSFYMLYKNCLKHYSSYILVVKEIPDTEHWDILKKLTSVINKESLTDAFYHYEFLRKLHG